MKKNGLLAAFLILANFAFSSGFYTGWFEKYIMTMKDSTLTYVWNELTGEWERDAITLYNYDGQFLESWTSYKTSTGDPAYDVSYMYDQSGRISEILYMIWNGTEWVNYQLHQHEYNPEDLLRERKVQRWIDGNWENFNYILNTYDDEDRWITSLRRVWDGNKYQDYSIDTFIYDPAGYLIYRYGISLPERNIFYEYLFTWENGLRTKLLRRDISGGVLQDNWQNIYEYNHCGMGTGYIQQIWNGEGWVNQLKVIEYQNQQLSSDYPFRKVPVCHKGKTILISKNALPAHLKHGDCIGPCNKYKKSYCKPCKYKVYKNHRKKSSLVEDLYSADNIKIYPNPFHDRLTIQLGNASQNVTMIELLDLSGRILKEIPVSGFEEIMIERENLGDGIYLLRIHSNEISVQKIIIN